MFSKKIKYYSLLLKFLYIIEKYIVLRCNEFDYLIKYQLIDSDSGGEHSILKNHKLTHTLAEKNAMTTQKMVLLSRIFVFFCVFLEKKLL